VNAEPRIVPPPRTPGESGLPNNETAPPELATVPRTLPSWHVWLLRFRALLFVTLCAIFGVLLIILPWTPKWTDNPLLLTSPDLRSFIANGFVRGIASGLGVLDLWLGFWEAIHYHEVPKDSG